MFDGILLPFQLFSSEEPFFSFASKPPLDCQFIAHPVVTEKSSAVEEIRADLSKSTVHKSDNQIWHRIHSLAGVTIGNDVEIGANTCIDRGTVKPTSLGDGVKADNLSQIGHNVQIGNNTLICAQVGIAGSAIIGNNVVLGGQSGISDNIFVGDNVITLSLIHI